MSGSKLAACLLNVSEGINVQVLRRIVEKAVTTTEAAAVINVLRDEHYNRTVITIAGPLTALRVGVVSACFEAHALIDLSTHQGSHPRLAPVDLVSIHPLNEATNLGECGDLARKIAAEIPKANFFFEEADLPLRRGLVQRRKELGWFQNSAKSLGMTGVGAAPYMANFNMRLHTDDLELSKKLASSVRETEGGLVGVHSMAFLHGSGETEVACNVNLVRFDNSDQRHQKAERVGELQQVFGDFYQAPFQVIESRLRSQLVELGHCDSLVGDTLEGLDPTQVKERFHDALRTGKRLPEAVIMNLSNG